MYLCAGDGPGRGTVGGDPDAIIGPEDEKTRRYVQGTSAARATSAPTRAARSSR